MGSPNNRDVDLAVSEMVRVLAPHADRDWRVPAGSLDWSCWTTAAHVAHDLLAYAGQVVARPQHAYLPFDLTVRPDAAPPAVLEVVVACGKLLSGALSAAAPDARGWHWGPTGPGGFAALGVNEILVHTYDIAQGLGIGWMPPEALSSAVLDRLFPEAPDGDPARVLLWCTGRADLAGRRRVTSWVPRAAETERRPGNLRQ
jgi:Mycothiol maleylpyruvate isomerase N-terminal domain